MAPLTIWSTGTPMKGDMRWEKKTARKTRTRLRSKKRSSSRRNKNRRRPSCPPRNPFSAGNSLPVIRPLFRISGWGSVVYRVVCNNRTFGRKLEAQENGMVRIICSGEGKLVLYPIIIKARRLWLMDCLLLSYGFVVQCLQ